MEIPKPTAEDKARFQDLVPEDGRVEVKAMFGNLGAFVNGNMFMGLFGADVGVKLPPDGLDEVMAAGGGPFGPRERPMSGYVALPASMDASDVRAFVDKAMAFVGEMAAKQPKKTKGSTRGK